jgi:hypothetical protein
MKPALFLLLSLLIVPPAFAQIAAPVLEKSAPINLKLVDAGFEEAVGMIGRYAGITIQWDAAISKEARSQPVTISFVNAQVAEALELLTKKAGLTYTVVDAKKVRIVPPVR